MVGITVMDHKNEKYAGKGFYLSSGVLKGFEGLVFHTLTSDDHSTTAMVEGAACSHRHAVRMDRPDDSLAHPGP